MGKCKSCGSTPTPYYEEAKNEVVQDHTNIFEFAKYPVGLEVLEEFQVPEEGEDIQVYLNNVTDLVVGSYLWNPNYGYLKVNYWDSCKGTVGISNEGLEGTAAPGSVVSAGTLFLASPKPCCADQDNFSLFPFLAEDFTVPSVSNSAILQVTSTFGLIAGTYVRISSGVYFLEQINSSLEIVIRNDGAGETPGTVVHARDANGDLQYLITSEIASACTLPGTDTIRLIGCNGASQLILTGEYEGQIPVLINPTTEEVQFALLDTSIRVCTSLVNAVNITPGIGNYTISVDDASNFNIGDILEVQSSSLRFEITGIVGDDIEVESIPSPPGVTQTLQSGEWICLILTTEFLQDEIDSIVSNLDSEYLRLDGANIGSFAANIVPFTNIQTINTDRLLGRDTASNGDIEELTVGGGLEFSGSGQVRIADGGITNDKFAAAVSNFSSVTVTPTSGTWTPLNHVVKYLDFGPVRFIWLFLGGSFSGTPNGVNITANPAFSLPSSVDVAFAADLYVAGALTATDFKVSSISTTTISARVPGANFTTGINTMVISGCYIKT